MKDPRARIEGGRVVIHKWGGVVEPNPQGAVEDVDNVFFLAHWLG